MGLWVRICSWRKGGEPPEHLRRGRLGEKAARKHLRRAGLRFLTANYTLSYLRGNYEGGSGGYSLTSLAPNISSFYDFPQAIYNNNRYGWLPQDVRHQLKAQAGQASASGRDSRWSGRNLLVAGQFALSLALLTTAGLFVRGALNASSSDPGYRFEGYNLYELPGPVFSDARRLGTFDRVDSVRTILDTVYDFELGVWLTKVQQRGTDSGVRRSQVLDSSTVSGRPPDR